MRISLGQKSLIGLACLAISCGPPKPKEKIYPMHGKILSLDEQSHLAKIDAGQIGDWMGPMAMDYPVPEKGDWQMLKAGQSIDATVHVKGDEFWVAAIHLTH